MKSLFRTFLSPYVGVAYLLFAGSFIVVSGRWDFLGDSYLTLETLSNFNIYTLPLLAAFVSYDTASLCRPGSLHMIAATPRWKAALLLPSIIATASITTTHIIMTLTMLMWGQVTNPMVGWERIALTLTLQILTFLAVALIGATIGRHTPAHTAGFIAFAALFLLALTSESFPGGTPGSCCKVQQPHRLVMCGPGKDNYSGLSKSSSLRLRLLTPSLPGKHLPPSKARQN